MRAHTAIVCLCLALAACETVVGVEWIDPPINLGDIDEDVSITGDPHVELGFYVEQLYAPLQDGDPCPVVHGLQGGTWTMPAIRIEGIAPVATVHCDFTTEHGETLGVVEAGVRFFLAVDGKYELQSFPIPVNHAKPHGEDPIDDLYGVGATLSCEVRDGDGRQDTATINVQITEG